MRLKSKEEKQGFESYMLRLKVCVSINSVVHNVREYMGLSEVLAIPNSTPGLGDRGVGGS